MKKKLLFGGMVAGLVVVIACLYFLTPVKEELPKALGLASTEFITYAGDVVGTKSGTSTTGVYFAPDSTTSTYVSKIGGSVDIGVYTIKVLSASSTATSPLITLALEGSNDDYCDTSTSTTIFDKVTTGQINWFPASNHLLGKTQNTALTNATSTYFITWASPMTGASNEIILTDLNWECLRLNVQASSTIFWAQLKTKVLR